MRCHQSATGLLSVVLGLLLCGCGGGPELPICYPVSGRVLVNGKPVVRAMVSFHPHVPQPNGKTYGGSTFTDDDGAFRLTTFTAGDGVPAGEYVVTISAKWESRNGLDVGVPDLFGGKYSTPAKSPLKVTVVDKPVELEPYDFPESSR